MNGLNSDNVHRNDFISIDPRDGVTMLTLEKSMALFKNLGRCFRCGEKTHKIGRPPFTNRTAITNENVYKGTCLKCTPLDSTSVQTGSAQSLSGSSSTQSSLTTGSNTELPSMDPPRRKPGTPTLDHLSRLGSEKSFNSGRGRSIRPSFNPSTSPPFEGNADTSPKPVTVNAAVSSMPTKKDKTKRPRAREPGVVRVTENVEYPKHRDSCSKDNKRHSSPAKNLGRFDGVVSLRPEFDTIVEEPPFFNTDTPPTFSSNNNHSHSYHRPSSPIEALITTLHENLSDTAIIQETCASLKKLVLFPSNDSKKTTKTINAALLQTLLTAMRIYQDRSGENGERFNTRVQIDSLSILERITSTNTSYTIYELPLESTAEISQNIMDTVVSVMDVIIAAWLSSDKSNKERQHTMARLTRKGIVVISKLLENSSLNKQLILRDEHVRVTSDAIKMTQMNSSNNESSTSSSLVIILEKGFSILEMLSQKNNGTKGMLVRNGGTEAIMNVMAKNSNDAALQGKACAILSHLCNIDDLSLKQSMVSNGAIDVTIRAMFEYKHDQYTQRGACAALSRLCISDEARQIMVVNSGILATVQAMNKFQDCKEIQADGCFVLAFLAEGGLEVKCAIESTGALNIISKVVKRYPNDDDVQLNGTCVISLLSDM
uniref:Uncharacterized protein n=1 Tax=Ditylum brightwellii TaxID=49249 RepID=A0A7S1ZFT0_9STRA